jgi:hypothetical protein
VYNHRSALLDPPLVGRPGLPYRTYPVLRFSPPPTFAVYLGGAIGIALTTAARWVGVVGWPRPDAALIGLAAGAVIGAYRAAGIANG